MTCNEANIKKQKESAHKFTITHAKTKKRQANNTTTSTNKQKKYSISW